MANITPGEARVGYEVFRSTDGQLSQNELQREVDQLGIRVSDRMFQHYRNLLNAGYDGYVSINRFDIIEGDQRLRYESAIGRYKFSEIGRAARVTVLRDDPFTFLALATRVSDAGFVLQLEDSASSQSIAKGRMALRPRDLVRVDLLEGVQSSVEARVVDKPDFNPATEVWLVDLEFTRLRSVVEFTSGEELAPESVPIRLLAADQDSVPADVLARRISLVLDALEGARTLFNDVAETQAHAYLRRASPARVSNLSMASPIEIVLVVPIGVASILASAALLANRFGVTFKTVQDGRLSGANARQRRAAARSIELDNELKVVLVQRRIREILEGDGAELDGGEEPTRSFRHAFDRLTRTIDALGEESVTSLELPAATLDPLETSDEAETPGRPAEPSD